MKFWSSTLGTYSSCPKPQNCPNWVRRGCRGVLMHVDQEPLVGERGLQGCTCLKDSAKFQATLTSTWGHEHCSSSLSVPCESPLRGVVQTAEMRHRCPRRLPRWAQNFSETRIFQAHRQRAFQNAWMELVAVPSIFQTSGALLSSSDASSPFLQQMFHLTSFALLSASACS